MKRTSLMLRPDLLEESARLGGERTYTIVERALEEHARRRGARRAYEGLRGAGGGEGNPGAMRQDAPRGRRA